MSHWRLDLHVHSRASSDGVDHAERLVDAAKAQGLHGIAITDHDRSSGYRRLVKLGLADPSGKPVDNFLVIPGVEVTCVEGHLIVLGATFNAPAGLRAAGVVRKAHALGALAIAPHPLDRCRHGLGRRVCDTLPLDAVEAFNSKTLDKASNEAARAYAARRNLPIVAGSDAHFARTVGRAHTIVNAPELSTRSILDAIAAARTQIVPGMHTRGEILSYMARGWFTRPWLFDFARRTVVNARRRRTCDESLLSDLIAE
jgi:predicted metal-dependent phosphoesterase TrpH